MNHDVHFHLFQHNHPHNFRIRNSVHRLHLAVNPVTPKQKNQSIAIFNDSVQFALARFLLDLAKLAAEAANRRVYCKQDSAVAVAVVVLSNVWGSLRQSIHRKMSSLADAKIVSVVIHAVFLVSVATIHNEISMHTFATVGMRIISARKNKITCIFYEILCPFYLISFQTNVG